MVPMPFNPLPLDFGLKRAGGSLGGSESGSESSRKRRNKVKRKEVDDEMTSPVSGIFIRRISDADSIEIKKGKNL